MVMGVLPNTWVVSTFTGSCISTINHILNREIGRRPCSFSLYVDSVCKDKKLYFVSKICEWLHIGTSVKMVHLTEPVNCVQAALLVVGKASTVNSEAHSMTQLTPVGWAVTVGFHGKYFPLKLSRKYADELDLFKALKCPRPLNSSHSFWNLPNPFPGFDKHIISLVFCTWTHVGRPEPMQLRFLNLRDRSLKT